VSTPGPGSAVRGTADEANRYSRRSLERSEAIYGPDSQSPGGLVAVAEFSRKLDLRPGMRVLDLGSGLGGAAFHLAQTYAAQVVGVDASADCVTLSRERAAARGIANVRFEHADICSVDFADGSFDLVWSRDVVACIADKARVFGNAYRWLGPDGRLFVTDFCRRSGPLSEEFRSYVEVCGYHLQDLSDYVATLEAAGFRQIEAQDLTHSLAAWMRRERDALLRRRAEFCERFGASDFEVMLDRWSAKTEFCEQHQLVWGHYQAVK